MLSIKALRPGAKPKHPAIADIETVRAFVNSSSVALCRAPPSAPPNRSLNRPDPASVSAFCRVS